MRAENRRRAGEGVPAAASRRRNPRSCVVKPPTPRQIWLALGLLSTGLVATSMILTAWLDLHPCHLCIFQRLLFMLLAVLGLMSALPLANGVVGRLSGALSLPTSGLGAGIAAYQSWLQAQPPNSISCVGGKPGLIERLVEWLGEQAPASIPRHQVSAKRKSW
ncbi:MAG: disulfide bond formation protein B [Comamonadaceae bacterium]|nr:disulfide bond formation protein B [Comamonadaceae bacterium]